MLCFFQREVFDYAILRQDRELNRRLRRDL
jgi:hypothetical protein